MILPQIRPKLTLTSNYMFNKIMISFHKNVSCPTSSELLAYRNNEIPADMRKEIEQHICSCDFCGAEVEFYTYCPKVDDEKVSVTEIPSPLYELAEAILNNKRKGNSLLNKLLNENEGLSLREA
jgi:hypothetical protein